MIEPSLLGLTPTQLRVIVRLINGIFTITFFPYLINIYLKNHRKFYLYLGTGFLLYGINIVIRGLIDYQLTRLPDSLHLVIFFFYTFAFVSILTGIGELLDRPKTALAISMVPFIVPAIANLYSVAETLAWMFSLIPYVLVVLSLYFIRRRYEAQLDLFIVGWLFLFMINIAIPLGWMTPIYTDLSAIIGKILIFIGIRNPRFSFLAEDIKRFLISGLPEEYPSSVDDHFILVTPVNGQREKEIEWISNKATENSRHGIRTILVTMYDLIVSKQLESKGMNRDDIYLVRMIPEGERVVQSIGDSVATMNDDLKQLKILTSEIIDFSNERNIRCNIILYSLSLAIHKYGAQEIFSSLLEQMPDIKSSNVQVYCFIYPDTHNESEVAMFSRISDLVLTI